MKRPVKGFKPKRGSMKRGRKGSKRVKRTAAGRGGYRQ